MNDLNRLVADVISRGGKFELWKFSWGDSVNLVHPGDYDWRLQMCASWHQKKIIRLLNAEGVVPFIYEK